MDLGWVVEAAEITAWTDMVRAAPSAVAERFGLEVLELGGAVGLVARRQDSPQFNRVMGIGLTRPVTPSDLEEIASTYRPLGLRHAVLQASPEAEPAQALPDLLTAAGYRRVPLDGIKLARPTLDPPRFASEFEVIEAEVPDARVFGATICAGFGMSADLTPWVSGLVGRPDWRCYLALDDRGPVAAAALYLADHVGWLGLATTRADRRGRGVQGALMARRIADAGRAGRSWTVTETTTPSGGAPSRALLQAGFSIVHRRANYAI
jgi:hypothetical protein